MAGRVGGGVVARASKVRKRPASGSRASRAPGGTWIVGEGRMGAGCVEKEWRCGRRAGRREGAAWRSGRACRSDGRWDRMASMRSSGSVWSVGPGVWSGNLVGSDERGREFRTVSMAGMLDKVDSVG